MARPCYPAEDTAAQRTEAEGRALSLSWSPPPAQPASPCALGQLAAARTPGNPVNVPGSRRGKWHVASERQSPVLRRPALRGACAGIGREVWVCSGGLPEDGVGLSVQGCRGRGTNGGGSPTLAWLAAREHGAKEVKGEAPPGPGSSHLPAHPSRDRTSRGKLVAPRPDPQGDALSHCWNSAAITSLSFCRRLPLPEMPDGLLFVLRHPARAFPWLPALSLPQQYGPLPLWMALEPSVRPSASPQPLTPCGQSEVPVTTLLAPLLGKGGKHQVPTRGSERGTGQSQCQGLVS